MEFKNLRLFGILVAIVFLLLAVYAAMKLSGDMQWSWFDFAVAGILLLGTGLAIEFVLRVVKTTTQRLMLSAAILFLLFIVWVELAVGLFGTPFAGS